MTTTNEGSPTRLWGGRFGGGPSAAMAALSKSTDVDWRLAPYDLAGSRAHARVLERAGLLSVDELARMIGALTELSAEVAEGTFAPIEADEDVHEALERGLLEKLGTLGGKLRAGRSRNDQVATDLRLYLRHNVRALVGELASLEYALIGLAVRYRDVAAPGMTHLQHAQPVLIAHQLLAHAHALARDVDRLLDWDVRAAVSPLGSGALAGSSLALDPDAVAAELGFDRAVGQLHRRGQRPRLRRRVLLRRRADRRAPVPAGGGGRALDVDRVRLGPAGRRLGDRLLDHAAEEEPRHRRAGPRQGRPVRRQPDRAAHDAQGPAAGLRPGPAGGQGAGLRLRGAAAPAAARGHRHGRHPHAAAGGVEAAAPQGFALATDVAEWLVSNGVPFRSAHEISGAMVAFCEEAGLELDELDDEQLAGIDERLTPEVRTVLHVEGALAARRARGGTAPERVAEQLTSLAELARQHADWSTRSPVAAAL